GALLAGDRETGTSVILLEERMDAGPILAQATLTIAEADDAVSLERRLAEQGAALLVDTLPRWEAGAVQQRPQDGAVATHTRLPTKEDGRLDWARPAFELARQVRACAGWPGATTEWRGQPLKVVRASAIAGPPDALPAGRVFESRDAAGRRLIAVAT